MKKKIINGLLLLALMVSSVGTFVSCKDYDDLYADLQSQISSESSTAEALETEIEELEGVLDDLGDWKDDLQAQLDAMAGSQDATITEAVAAVVAKAENRIDSILKVDSIQIATINTEILRLNAEIEALQNQMSCACPPNLAERLETLEELAKLITPEKWNQAAEDAAAALAKAEANEALIATMIEQFATKAAELEAQIAGKADQAEVDQLQAELANVKAEQTQLQEQLTSVSGRVEALEGAVEDLQGVLTDALDRIESLEGTVGELSEKLTAEIARLEGRIDAVKETVDKLKEDFLKMVTGITVQAAESPVAGYLNTPVGLNSTILAVYFGTPDEDWDFPATYATPYVNKDADFKKLTERNRDILGSFTKVPGYSKGEAGQIIVTGKNFADNTIAEGNAGTLYLTVNPSTVDFEGAELKLVNSQDVEAPAVLSPLKRSDRELTFGFTRAADNGFYEAQATIKNPYKAEMNIDLGAIKENVKDLLNNRNASSVLELGGTLLQSASNVLPAYGVMAPWEDNDGTTHKLYSQYNVAATAVTPLSLAFVHDWKGINQMPGLDRLENLVGSVIDKIKIDLNLNLPDFSKYEDIQIEFGKIEVPEIGDKFKIEFRLKLTDDNGNLFVPIAYQVENEEGTVKLLLLQIMRDEKDGYYVYKLFVQDENGNYNEMPKADWEKNGFVFNNLDEILNQFLVREIDFSEEMASTMEDIVKSINESITGSDINGQLGDLFTDIAKIGDLDGTISGAIEDAKNEIKSQINGYITRINNKLTKWINRAPGLLNLTLIGNSGNSVGVLSQAKAKPTKASGELTLIPTTYNLELVAPTYKKFVAVTDVFANGADADKKIAQEANNGNNLKKVIEGNATCTLKGKSGYTYEVTYMAIDYFGKVAIRKYYVKF